MSLRVLIAKLKQMYSLRIRYTKAHLNVILSPPFFVSGTVTETLTLPLFLTFRGKFSSVILLISDLQF